MKHPKYDIASIAKRKGQSSITSLDGGLWDCCLE